MRKKAQLDILDIPLHEDETSPKPGEGLVAIPEKGGDSQSKKGKFFPWIAICAIIIIAIQGALWYFSSISPVDKDDRSNRTTAAPPPAVGRVNMGEFFVHVWDDHGNPRVMVCGFILEVDPLRQSEISQKQNDIRKFMYETIAGRSVSGLLDSQGKRLLKKDLFEGLEKLLGKDVLKALYVDKYMIL